MYHSQSIDVRFYQSTDVKVYTSRERCKLLHLYIAYDTFIILFRTFNVSNLCTLPPWWWPNSWPTHVGVHWVYKLILIYLCVFVGTIILYIPMLCLQYSPTLLNLTRYTCE